MAGETVTPPAGQPTSTEAPPITPPATPGTGQPPASAAAATAQPASKTVVMPTNALTRIKQEQRDKGRKEALAELAAQLGYDSVEELAAAMPRAGGSSHPQRRDDRNRGNGRGGQPAQHASTQPGEPPVAPTPPTRGADREEWRRYERARAQFEKDREMYKRRLVQQTNRTRELQRQLDAKDAEMALREIAVRTGVRDLDYAIRLITRHLDGKSEEELKDFDEQKFFEGLRTTHPYLFGETVVPATTGTSGQPPPPPKPGATTAAAAQAGQFDARDEKAVPREKLNDKLRSMGLNPIGV